MRRRIQVLPGEIPTKSRDRRQAVFGRPRTRRVEPPGPPGVHPNEAERGKQRRGPKKELRILQHPPYNEAVNESVRARVDELGGTHIVTNATRNLRESRRYEGEPVPIQRRERPGNVLHDRFDDARGRLADPHGVDGELRRHLIVDGEQGDPAADMWH